MKYDCIILQCKSINISLYISHYLSIMLVSKTYMHFILNYWKKKICMAHIDHWDWLVFISKVSQVTQNPPAKQETRVQSLGWEDSLEKEMATHSSIPAWKIPLAEEPGRLQSMGQQRVGHDRDKTTTTIMCKTEYSNPRLSKEMTC